MTKKTVGNDRLAPGLFAEPEPVWVEPVHTPGRHSKALDDAVEAATQSGQLVSIDGGAISAAQAAAFALDAAERSAKPYYPIAQLLTPYRDILEALRMTPGSRSDASDAAIKSLLSELGTPTPAGNGHQK